MKHLFVSYHIALALKEKGFDEECLANYKSVLGRDGNELIVGVRQKRMIGIPEYFYLPAPIYQQAQDWLRKQGVQITEILGNSERWSVYKYGNLAAENLLFPDAFEEALKLIKT